MGSGAPALNPFAHRPNCFAKIRSRIFGLPLGGVGFPGGSVVKNLPAKDSIPWLERSPEGGPGNPLQCCLENPMDREAWQAIVHGITKSQTHWTTEHVPERSRGDILKISGDKQHKEAIKMGWDGLMWGANPWWWWLKCLLKAQMSNAHFKVICIFVMEALPFSHQICSELCFTNECFGDYGRRGEEKKENYL